MPVPRLILASTSPRRKELLALLNIPFDVIPPTSTEEEREHESAADHVKRLALEKARSVAHHDPSRLVIGSDTVIELDGDILGKPAGLEEARTMLTRLRGRTHTVHTGLALVSEATGMEKTWVESVTVWMKDVSDSTLAAYLKTGDSLGKAGAYSIQGEGAHLIEKIEGDYPAVVGLPLRQTALFLKEAGLRLPINVEDLYRTRPYGTWNTFPPGETGTSGISPQPLLPHRQDR
jgi:septum formation protein